MGYWLYIYTIDWTRKLGLHYPISAKSCYSNIHTTPCRGGFRGSANISDGEWEGNYVYCFSTNVTVFLHSYTCVFRHVLYFKLVSDKGFRQSEDGGTHWRKRPFNFWLSVTQPAKSLKSNTGGRSFCRIGIQYAMPYSQKYTPPHCFFCNFAGLVVNGLL